MTPARYVPPRQSSPVSLNDTTLLATVVGQAIVLCRLSSCGLGKKPMACRFLLMLSLRQATDGDIDNQSRALIRPAFDAKGPPDEAYAFLNMDQTEPRAVRIVSRSDPDAPVGDGQTN